MNPKRETIFIDIDETAAETLRDGVCPRVNARYGTRFSHATTQDYRDVFWDLILEDGRPVSQPRKVEIFNGAILEDRGTNAIQPVVGSVEKILELSADYDIGMLTARHPMLVEYTPEWVRHHYGNSVGKILFSNCFHGGKRKKSDICVEEKVKIMVEDDMDYALEIAHRGVLVFLLARPWNVHRREEHRNIRRIDSWNDLRI